MLHSPMRSSSSSMPMYLANPIILLLLLLLLLASPTVASPAPAFTKIVPPALPTESWVGQSSIDYAATHDKYAALLVCIWIPLGTFGFAYWFSLLFITIGNILKSHSQQAPPPGPAKQQQSPHTGKRNFGKRNLKKKLEGTRWGAISQACLTTLWSVFTLVQNALTLGNCQSQPHFEVIRQVICVFLVADMCSAVAGVCLVFWKGAGGKRGVWYFLSFSIAWMAVFLHCLGAAMGVRVVLQLQDDGEGVSVLVESVSMPAKIPVFLAWVVISLLGFAAGMFLVIKRNHTLWKGIGMALFGLVFGTVAGLFGLAFVYLGNVVGSPWGTYYLMNTLGQVIVGLTGFVSLMEVVILASTTWS